MTTNLNEIFTVLAESLEDLSKGITKDSSSYQFEASLNILLQKFGQLVFQSLVGNIPKSKNDRVTILTSMGNICFSKNHPLATAPGGFKISPYLQEHLCRVGTKLTFEEASEEATQLMGVDVNAKQIERLCHHYGDLLGQVDWKQAYNEAIQLRLPLKDEVTYAMMDGSMILTREKDNSWKEVKLCRTFQSNDRVENISKERNYIDHSIYIAHLGGHDLFFDKVLDVLPSRNPMVFICDGAKWIWKWIEEYYPNSTQILDIYHCKEHLYAFAKIYYAKDEHQSRKWVESCIELLMNKKTPELLTTISNLSCNQKHIEKERQKLSTYLQNNENRINYGLYKEQGLLFGSGAIESANRDIIQKRMKLSGQRWTLSGAQQMLNLRVCYKSGIQEKLHQLITQYQEVA
jgi:hypothetical protein